MLSECHVQKFTSKMVLGIIAYLFVIFFLIRCFSSKNSLMWTSCLWEGAILILGAIVSFFILGEKFTHWVQYLGILLALLAILCVNYKS